MKIHVYNKNCADGGLPVPERLLKQHKNSDKNKDWNVYEGSKDELCAMALKESRLGGCYNRQVAKTLLAAIGFSGQEIALLVYRAWDKNHEPEQRPPTGRKTTKPDHQNPNERVIDNVTTDVSDLPALCNEGETNRT